MQDITYGFDQIKQPFFIWKERFQEPRNMSGNHYHDAYEIYYLLEGERNYFIKDRTYHIQKGDLILIDVNELHKTMDAQFPIHERILLNFKKNFLPQETQKTVSTDLFQCFHQQTNLLRLDSAGQDFIRSLLLKMVAENDSFKPDSTLYLQTLLTELLIVLNRQFTKRLTGPFPFPNQVHQKIAVIIDFLNKNYQQDLNLSMLAEHFLISKYYLSRTFKDITGFTLVEYINGIRTKQAQHMLKTTTYNVTTISQKVGFDNQTHFGRVFKAITGSAPLQYRRTVRQNL